MNKAEEDVMYNEMMLSLLEIVTKPLRHVTQALVSTTEVGYTDIQREASLSGDDSQASKQQHGFWMQVHSPSPVSFGTKELWKNLLNWRAFTLKNRLKVMV